MDVDFMGAYMSKCTATKDLVTCLSTLLGNDVLCYLSSMHVHNWKTLWDNEFAKVYSTHHALKYMNIFIIQMSKSAMLKLKYIIFHW